MTDHEYKAGWMGLRGLKACKICGKGRGDHWKPFEDWESRERSAEADRGYKASAHDGTQDRPALPNRMI